MRQITIWASRNKVSARIIIIASYIVLNITGLFLGDLLYSMQITWNPLWFILPVMLTLAGLVFYPEKNKKHFYQNFYKRQKLSDGLLIGATFIFIVFTGNFLNKYNLPVAQTFGSNISYAATIENHISNAPNHSKNKIVLKKSPRKSVRAQIKALRKAYKETSNAEKVLVIILIVLAAGALASGVMALSCSISCSGSEALGFIVGIVGLGAIIFGAVKLIQKVTRRKKRGTGGDQPDVAPAFTNY